LSLFKDDGDTSVCHANLLIFRKKENTIEWFEPWGNTVKDDDYTWKKDRRRLNDKLFNFYLKTKVNIIWNEDLIPIQSESMSTDDEFGFCMICESMIAYLSIKYPDASLRSIIQHIEYLINEHSLTDNINDLRMDLQRGFLEYMYDIVNEQMKRICPIILPSYLHLTNIPTTKRKLDTYNKIKDTVFDFLHKYKLQRRLEYRKWADRYNRKRGKAKKSIPRFKMVLRPRIKIE